MVHPLIIHVLEVVDRSPICTSTRTKTLLAAMSIRAGVAELMAPVEVHPEVVAMHSPVRPATDGIGGGWGKNRSSGEWGKI